MVNIIGWKSDYKVSIMGSLLLFAMAACFIILYYYVPDIRGLFVIPLLIIGGIIFIFMSKIEKNREYLIINFEDISNNKIESFKFLISETLENTLLSLDQNINRKNNMKLEFSIGSSIVWDLGESNIKVYLNLIKPRYKRYRVFIYPSHKKNAETIKVNIRRDLGKSIAQFV